MRDSAPLNPYVNAAALFWVFQHRTGAALRTAVLAAGARWWRGRPPSAALLLFSLRAALAEQWNGPTVAMIVSWYLMLRGCCCCEHGGVRATADVPCRHC
jgi:hypothetical protein